MQKVEIKKNQKILFVISIIQYFIEAKNLFLFFKKKGFEVVILFGWKGDKLSESIKFCKDNQIKYHLIPIPFSYTYTEKTKKNKINKISLRNKILFKVLKIWLVERFLTVYASIKNLKELKSYIKNYLNQNNYNFVFAGPYSSIGKFDNVIAYYCNKKKIPFFCFPVFNDICESFNIESRSNLLKAGMLSKILFVNYDIINILLGFLFPNWIRKKENRRFFMHDPILLLTSKICGILEDNIWSKPSRFFNLIFVESSILKKQLVEVDKWSKEKIIVSGKPSSENIFKLFRNVDHKKKIFNYLELKSNINFILYNVEPGWEHHYMEKKKHWKHFEQICKILHKTKKEVILSLHPMCNYDHYKFVIKKYNFKISDKFKIFDLLPHCWFVVSHFCTTNLIANKLKKKTLLFDVSQLSLSGNDFSTQSFFRSKYSEVVTSYSILESKIQNELTKKKMFYRKTPFYIHQR